ncbi:hypothetical protein [Burkholderia cepacia]|uniref:Uncharacterized protein n=1 Tax=Burkholderia cepacia TaxID=292 RepID=A0AA88Z300_BURCE|nr:hypothetical protein [Burkholderia cepacia]KGB99493.1 hypothetical protein DM43_3098 [Burkholderia cepacia]
MNQHEISTANGTDDSAAASTGIRQLPTSNPTVANDVHRVIADDWLRGAIDGIRVMHFDDDERLRIARGLF